MTKKIKKTHRWRWLSLLCICIYLLGCESLSPTISEEFVNAYIELRIVSLELGDVNPNARIKRTEILKKYNYSTESFNQESERIKTDPKLWLLFQQKVVSIVDSLPETRK